MPRDDHTVGGEIEILVPLVIIVSLDDTVCRAGHELMRSDGREIRIASAPEDMDVLMGGVLRRERSGCGKIDHLGRKAVEEVGRDVQHLGPVASVEGSLKQQGAHHDAGGSNHAFDSTILVLRRNARTQHSQLDTLRERITTGLAIALPPVITLDTRDGTLELSGNQSEEMREYGKHVELQAQRKSTQVTRKIINDQQIILKAQNARTSVVNRHSVQDQKHE